MTLAVDLSNLAMEANGAAAGITANTTAISAISVGNSTVNTSITTGVALTATATAAYTPQIVLNNLANDATGAFFTLTKSRSGGASLSSDSLGTLYFNGTNTANGLTYAAAITAIQTSSANATATPAALGFNVLGGVEKMRITSNGNVGIGATVPGSKLTVSGGNINADQTTGTWMGFGTSTFTFRGAAQPDYGIGYNTNSGADFSTVLSGYSGVIFTTVQTEKMRITSDGNVGIGTSSPLTQLNVSYSILATADGGYYGGQAYYASGAWRNAVTGQGGYAIRNTTGVFTVFTGASANAAGTPFANFVERMRIDSAGNVGIGTSTPSNTLSVTGTAGISGALTVNGAITTGNTDLGNNQVATVAFAIAVAYTL